MFSLNDPLSVYGSEDQVPLHNFVPISLNRSSQPRQGINTSGANALFFFKAYQQLDNGLCLVNETILLPQQFVFPLLTSSNFKDESKEVPKKWVLLPYDPTTGKPLDWSVIEEFDELKRYLTIHKDQLSKRKGAMIQSMIKRGHWWSLLGVGQYCFSPFKVVWEAYGKSTFNPRIISSDWQVNQSLQAYIPVNTHQEAQRVLDALLHPSIEHYLLSLKMEGTMNWAQPGKIKKLIEFTD